jgi:hypothetical protein
MFKSILAAVLSLALCSCSALGGLMGPPPQASTAVQTMSRTALDFALNSFDAALYGLDFMMDTGKLQPGSDQARRIAAAGRKVMNFLGVAEAARDLGSAATYEEAFANAKTALDEFRSLFPTRAAVTDHPVLTDAERMAIIERLEGRGALAPVA